MEKEIFLADFIATVIEDMETGKRLKFRQSCKVAEGYIINFKSALLWVRRFDEAKGRRVSVDEVDMVFQREFVGFLVAKGLKPNTIKTRMSVIHTVMREALVRGLTRNDAFMDQDFIPLLEATDSVYLTEKQIDELWKMDFNKIGSGDARPCIGSGDARPCVSTGGSMNDERRRRLEMVRDLFLMGCETGQRFSDYSRIEESMVVSMAGYRFVSLRQKKTDQAVLIPVTKRMEELLRRYDGRMPVMKRKVFNNNLKVLGEIMGWTWRPDSAEGDLRFCDMMSSHTARRSFATNAYQRGVPLKSIMAVTGHTSERTLRIYLRLGAKEKAMMAARDFQGFLNIRRAGL